MERTIGPDCFKNLSDAGRSTFNSGAEQSSPAPEQKLFQS